MENAREAGDRRRRRRLAAQVKESMRELSVQLAVLNHQVSSRLELRSDDFDCLDLINRHGPLSPSALAKRAGQHPATTTGILDRLERGGWVVREPDPADRRAVTVSAVRERNAEVYRMFGPMNRSMDELLDEYDEAQLDLLSSFIRRATDAGRTATATLLEG